MVVMSDTEDPFVPLPDDLLVNLRESRAVFESLLDSLPATFAANSQACCLCLNPNYQLDVELSLVFTRTFLCRLTPHIGSTTTPSRRARMLQRMCVQEHQVPVQPNPAPVALWALPSSIRRRQCRSEPGPQPRPGGSQLTVPPCEFRQTDSVIRPTLQCTFLKRGAANAVHLQDSACS